MSLALCEKNMAEGFAWIQGKLSVTINSDPENNVSFVIKKKTF